MIAGARGRASTAWSPVPSSWRPGSRRRQIERRAANGRGCARVHRGVYARRPRRRCRAMGVWMAAVLAAGEGAVLSHWSAATLLADAAGARAAQPCHSAAQAEEHPTITFHHAHLPPDEVTEEQGIPATTPARTLLDLAPLLPSPVLARMVEAAPPSGGAALARAARALPRRAGVPKLRAIARDAAAHDAQRSRGDAAGARSRSAGLPRPRGERGQSRATRSTSCGGSTASSQSSTPT